MIFCFAASALLILAQTATTPTTPQPGPPEIATPKDGRERLALAAKVNGLHGLEHPWHLKATYQVFGPEGDPIDMGTYEEWRVSDQQYRVALHGRSLATEEFGTDYGVFRSGGPEWPRKPLSSIRGILAQPVPPDVPPQAVLENFQKNFSAGKLPCTAVMKRGIYQTPHGSPSFCFGLNNGVIVYSSAPNQTYETEFTHTQLVQGHYLALDIAQFLEGRPWLKIHVDTVEDLAQADYAALTVPSGALPVPPRLNLTGSLDQAPAIHQIAPNYPESAKQKGIQGTVVLNGVINKEGRFRGLRVLGGPQALQQAALDAVSQWVYQPYLVDGKPVEVETDVRVEFHLSRRGTSRTE